MFVSAVRCASGELLLTALIFQSRGNGMGIPELGPGRISVKEGTNGRVAGKASVCAGTGWGGPRERRVSDAMKDVGGGARMLSWPGARVTSYKIDGAPPFEEQASCR